MKLKATIERGFRKSSFSGFLVSYATEEEIKSNGDISQMNIRTPDRRTKAEAISAAIDFAHDHKFELEWSGEAQAYVEMVIGAKKLGRDFKLEWEGKDE